MLNNEMNYFQILQQLKKIKTSLAILIGDDSELIHNAKMLYMKYSTIYDEDGQTEFKKTKNAFMRYIDRDEILWYKDKKRKSQMFASITN